MARKDGTIILLDIGRNTGKENGDQKSFFEEARECTSRIIERKILSQGKDLMAIILLGAAKTKNSMAEQVKGAFRHIEVQAELQEPTWQMIRNLPEQPTNKQSSWIDGLVVAADHFTNGISGTKFNTRRIMLMTNFKQKVDLQDSEQVLQGLKNDGYEVDVFGLDIDNPKEDNENVNLARTLVEITNGVAAPFADTMKYLLFHKRKTVKPMPWNVDLSVGANIKIPVSAYIRIKEEPAVKSWQRAVKDPVTATASHTEGILKNKVHINVENECKVEAAEVIKGYQYGQQLIPITEADLNILYKPGDRSLTVYGFTDARNVTWQNLNGDGLSYVFGRKGDRKAQHALRCLVECLHELNLVGIVRKVHNKGNAPKMFALMPVIDSDNFVCLSMAAICYKEDLKYMAFPPTNGKKYNTTDKQVNAFKDLIKAMDLTKAYDENMYDDTEAFPVAEMVSPQVQYVLDCIAYRAMNPGKPLPPPRDDIMMLFKQPPLIEERSTQPMQKLKTLFVLNKVEKKTNKRNKKDKQPENDDDGDEEMPDDEVPTTSKHLDSHMDIPKVQLPKMSDEVTRIGTMQPVKDFETLSSKGKTLAELTPDMTDVIENLFYSNLDGSYTKAMDTIKFFRQKCVENEPSYYNEWLMKFKRALYDRRKTNILDLITEKQVGFILKAENSLSTFETEGSHEESQMYENDTIPNTGELKIESEINDMFDEM